MKNFYLFLCFLPVPVAVCISWLVKDYKARKKSLGWTKLPGIDLIDETRFIDEVIPNKMLLKEHPLFLDFGIWYTIPKGFTPIKGTTIAFKYFDGQPYIIPVKNHHKKDGTTVSFDLIKKANSPDAVQLTILPAYN